jgi:hypothetical protein
MLAPVRRISAGDIGQYLEYSYSNLKYWTVEPGSVVSSEARL